jgi:hypothetical protein
MLAKKSKRKGVHLRTGTAVIQVSLPFEGGCACGAVRYRVEAQPIMTFQCHCVDCQHASGGPFVAGALVPKTAFTFTKGSPTYYSTPSTRGGMHVRGFCASCGSRLTGGERDVPTPFVGVVVSSLDDRSWFKPQMHFFVSQKQTWDVINDAAPQYDLYPPMSGNK